MQVFKFGGSSVKDAEGVKNVAKIIDLYKSEQILVVISAMGKTTNALEKVTKAYFFKDGNPAELLDEVKNYHFDLLNRLFEDSDNAIFDEIGQSIGDVAKGFQKRPPEDFDFVYDQIVSLGEILSTKIVSAYLNAIGLQNTWLDAREYIHTDHNYREGKIQWTKTKYSVLQDIPTILNQGFVVTQGFLGGTSEGFTTTLGREGSDYSAAIFASCLGAEAVTIWKDVPGVLNADPRLFSKTYKFNQLSYQEAIEMTYYGATVIHPKTIKPLQNANIPLKVKPFLAPEESGTIVWGDDFKEKDISAIIVKQNQVLVSISTRDFSFITEDHLSEIYAIFAQINIKISVSQNSALSFSICCDDDEIRFPKLLTELEKSFKVRYNTNLKLFTIRHYTDEVLEEHIAGRKIFLEQYSRTTAQIVVL
jgi:aspartate kinase